MKNKISMRNSQGQEESKEQPGECDFLDEILKLRL